MKYILECINIFSFAKILKLSVDVLFFLLFIISKYKVYL
jgi:hypothetical protein